MRILFSVILMYDLKDARVPDAIRLSDGKFVALKIISKQRHPDEISIAAFMSSLESPRNHCVPILDTIDMEGNEPETIIVMPLLRRFDTPRFDTLGEVVEFFRQIFEVCVCYYQALLDSLCNFCQGLQYMHEHGVAHRYFYLTIIHEHLPIPFTRDITSWNVLMDASPLFPIPYHPGDYSHRRDWKGRSRNLTRTQRPVKYYFIDFGYASRYPPGMRNPLEIPKMGGDKTLPELDSEPRVPTNPFKADIYCLGNLIREEFLEVCGTRIPTFFYH
jgi:serine/threonine protein kinase